MMVSRNYRLGICWLAGTDMSASPGHPRPRRRQHHLRSPDHGRGQGHHRLENADLFWGLRGAGHNFGIVSSLTVRAFPEINEGLHYKGMVAFPDVLLEKVVAGLNALDLQTDCSIEMLFIRAPPTFEPVIALSLWHAGSVESAHERFGGLFDLGGMVVKEGLVPYDHLNDGLDPLCARGT
jgi:hypothetical protein